MMKVCNVAITLMCVCAIFPSANTQANDTIYACAHKGTGKLRVVDAPGQCRKREYDLAWGSGERSEQQINELVGRVAAIEAALGVINEAPQVFAGVDDTILVSMVIAPESSVTDDGLLRPLTYLWDEPDASGSVEFLSPRSLETDVIFASPGVYTLRLSVNDGAVSVSDDLQVTVYPDNTAPTVSFNEDPLVVPAAYIQGVPGRWSLACKDINLGALVADDGLPLPLTYDWQIEFIRGVGSTPSYYALDWGFSTSESDDPNWPLNLIALSNRYATAPQAASLPSSIDGTWTLAVSDGYHGTDATIAVTCDVRASQVPSADAGPAQSLVGLPTDQRGSYECTFDLAGTAIDDDLPLPLTVQWSSSTPPAGFGWRISQAFSDATSVNTSYRMRIDAVSTNQTPDGVSAEVRMQAYDGYSASDSSTNLLCTKP